MILLFPALSMAALVGLARDGLVGAVVNSLLWAFAGLGGLAISRLFVWVVGVAASPGPEVYASSVLGGVLLEVFIYAWRGR